METNGMAKTASKQSKAAFVRSLPPSMPAKEVIEKAKAAGHKLSPAYVYVIRSKGSSSKAKSGGSAKTGRGRGARTGSAGAERALIDAALELGFSRARQVLDAAQTRIRQSI
jgi:hypothetical protein